jgi:hypothetical protein
MTFAHIGGVPVEESVQALAPAGATIIYMAVAWLRRR